VSGKRKVNPLSARLLLFFCRHHIPLLSRAYRLLLNCDIFCDTRGRGLLLPHPYGIVIHSKTRLGQRVVIMQQVTLGARIIEIDEAPAIEDDVYVGAGAKILGGVRIGRGAVIGANAVVTRDVPAGATVVGANRILSEARCATPR
jgi:serine acetyltransferase